MKSLGAAGIFFLIAVFVTPASVFCQDDDAFWNAFEFDGGMSAGYPGSLWRLSLNPGSENIDSGAQKLKAIGGFPLFIGVGKVYFPHGRFDKSFLSDSITRELVGASKGGAASDALEYGSENQIRSNPFGSQSAGVIIDTPAEFFPSISFSGGVSYVSGFSGNKIFQHEAGPGSPKEEVGGISAFMTVIFVDSVSIAAEYMTATDKFEVGGLNSELNQRIEPKAWNFELTFIPLTDMEVALRYGGSKDTGDILHKIEYGGAIDMGLFRNTSLALEYIYKEFENNSTANSVAARFAVDF